MRRLSLIALLALALAAPLAAQQGQQPPPPPSQPATVSPGQQPQQPPPGRATQQGRGGRGTPTGEPPPASGRGVRNVAVPDQNVRLDVTITDSAQKSQKKVVSMLMADGESGRIRSSNNLGVLNVDGNTRVAPDGRIHVFITIEYLPDRSAATTELNQSISLMVAAGKPTQISQSADPGTDRKVSVEITATVVK